MLRHLGPRFSAQSCVPLGNSSSLRGYRVLKMSNLTDHFLLGVTQIPNGLESYIRVTYFNEEKQFYSLSQHEFACQVTTTDLDDDCEWPEIIRPHSEELRRFSE
jgi:hypothetical protein